VAKKSARKLAQRRNRLTPHETRRTPNARFRDKQPRSGIQPHRPGQAWARAARSRPDQQPRRPRPCDRPPARGRLQLHRKHGLAQLPRDGHQEPPTPSWYKDWRTEMRKAGSRALRDRIPGSKAGQGPRIPVADHTHAARWTGTDATSSRTSATDVIKAEKKNPEIWDLKGEYSGKTETAGSPTTRSTAYSAS